MNYLLLAAAVPALITLAGHTMFARKAFLRPILESNVDPLTKVMINGVFHYVGVFMIGATTAFLLTGLGLMDSDILKPVILFIAANYAGFGIIQFKVSYSSQLENGVKTTFHWALFILISGLGFAHYL